VYLIGPRLNYSCLIPSSLELYSDVGTANWSRKLVMGNALESSTTPITQVGSLPSMRILPKL